MAQRGYPGIHAGMPTPQCLRSASVVNGAPRSTSSARRPDSRPGFGRTRFSCGSEPARDSDTSVASRVDGLTSRAGSLPHWDRATPARDRPAVRPLSRASFAPTGPAQQIRWVYTRKNRPAVRPPREQALLPQVRLNMSDGCTPARTGRLSGRLAFDFDLGRPVNHAGRTQVLRSGHLGMDAEVAALGHGWPFAAGPRSNAGVRACRA